MVANQAVLVIFLQTSRRQFGQSSAEGAGTFRSKALVSSGNIIARRNWCVVFSLPRSLRKGLNLSLRRRGRR